MFRILETFTTERSLFYRKVFTTGLDKNVSMNSGACRGKQEAIALGPRLKNPPPKHDRNTERVPLRLGGQL